MSRYASRVRTRGLRPVTIAALLLATLGLAACDGPIRYLGDPPPSPPRPTASPSPVASTPEASSSEPLATDLEDGRHAVVLHSIDVQARRLTVDVVQFLTGDEARAAYQSEYPDDPGGPPNDYYIVNANPRLRTLPVSYDVTVQLVRLHEDSNADLNPATWDELPGYLEGYRPDDGTLSFNPFWLTIESNVIVAIEEQYIP